MASRGASSRGASPGGPLRSEYLGLLAVLLALIVLFGLLSDHFWSRQTLATIANRVPAATVVAVGMTYVLIVGGIDLSVGSVMALAGAVLGVAVANWGWPPWCGAALGLGVGLACGALSGCVTVAWSIPSFIVTLGVLEMARGAAYWITNSETKYLSGLDGVSAPVPGLGLSPAILLALAVVAAAQLVLSHTVFGRYVKAVGANEHAAWMAGVHVWRTRVAVFAGAGLLSGLAGIFHASRLSTADPNAGIGMELSAIAAVVVGGTSLLGGRGSVVSSFLGVLIINVLETGLVHVGSSDPTKRVITGGVIVAAVIADTYRHRLINRGASHP